MDTLSVPTGVGKTYRLLKAVENSDDTDTEFVDPKGNDRVQ